MKCEKCSFQIIPEKEKGRALIQLLLANSDWEIYKDIQKRLLDSLPEKSLFKHQIREKKTLSMELNYSDLETAVRRVEEILSLEKGIQIENKKIFIKKLGGWFDV